MSKLYFRYGTENCGKSAALMFSAYNYKEIKKRVFLIKPFDNSKYGDKISSKIGLESKVSLLVSDNYNFSNPHDRLARVRVIDNIFNYSNNPTLVKSMMRSYKKPIDYINRSVNR